MSMFRCTECEHLFEEGEQARWVEEHGEEFVGCPLCKSAYEEAVRCEICEEYHAKDELSSGVCDECLEKHKNNVDLCQEFSADEKDTIRLSAFLVSMFNEEEITEILIEKLKSENADCSKFINDDKDWFAEKLVEKKEGK